MPTCENCALHHLRCSLTSSNRAGTCGACRARHIHCQPRSHSTTLAQTRTRSTRPNLSGTLKRGFSQIPTAPTEPRLTQPNLDVEQIHISLDPGCDYTKAAIQLHFANGSKSRTMPVVWANNETTVPTQVIIQDDGSIIWGEAVSNLLCKHPNEESHVIKRFKPSFFEAHQNSNEEILRSYGNFMTQNRVNEVCKSLEHYGERPESYNLVSLVLYSEYLGAVNREVLFYISRIFGRLGWPNKEISQYKNWTRPEGVLFHISLPLPVGSRPRQTQAIIASARAAGLPNPYPVAEPAAALIHYLEESCGYSVTGNLFAIIDIGAGSIDLQVWKVAKQTPLRLHEVEIPDNAKTIWAGGSFVDAAAADLVMRGIKDMDRVLHTLSKAHSTITSREMLARRISDEFQQEKRKFRGSESLYLRIPGLPDVPEFRLSGGGMVILSTADVKSIFAVSLEATLSMLDAALIKVSDAASQPTTGPQRVNEILVVGGGSHSLYLLEQIRNRYHRQIGSPVDYEIPVTEPPDATKGSNTVSRGALHLTAEKGLIHQRNIRRSYFVGWWTEDKSRRYPKEAFEKSDHDGRPKVFVTKFLLKSGTFPQRFETKPVKGWRGLLEEDFDHEKNAWLIAEALWYSDTLSEDGLWIFDPNIDLHSVPGTLYFLITREDAADFPEEKDEKCYRRFDYEVQMQVDGETTTWLLTIPRSGCLSKTGDRYGDNPLKKTGQFDTSGVIQLYNSG